LSNDEQKGGRGGQCKKIQPTEWLGNNFIAVIGDRTDRVDSKYSYSIRTYYSLSVYFILPLFVTLLPVVLPAYCQHFSFKIPFSFQLLSPALIQLT
jgi:hypothetical protein